MDSSATRYRRLQLALGGLGVSLDTAYLVAAVALGAGPALAGFARAAGGGFPVEVAVVAAGLGAGQAVFAWPLAWIRGFRLPRRFGLLHQPFAAWLADRVKAAALGAALGLVLIEAIYALLRASDLWWVWAAVVVTALGLVTALIFPIWIVPLFYRMAPLADDALRRRLLALAQRAGIRAVDVVVVDQSRKSRTANAGLTGFGRTRRIILFDTLVTRFTPDEIEGVLAHELGHHVHHDMWRGVALQAGLALATFWCADRILRATLPLAGGTGIGDPAGLPWLALVLGALGLVAVPIANLVSRRREFRADAFALRTMGQAGPLASALERLADLNLAERRPPRLVEALLHSHPSIERRVAALLK